MRGAIPPFPYMSPLRDAQLKHRDKFTFTFTFMTCSSPISLWRSVKPQSALYHVHFADPATIPTCSTTRDFFFSFFVSV
jgi:hypothetical protein